jgi:hypothetical protein
MLMLEKAFSFSNKMRISVGHEKLVVSLRIMGNSWFKALFKGGNMG